MTERPSERAAVADGAVGDAGGDALHSAARDVRDAPILDVGVGDTCAENEFVAVALRLLELGEPGDVDDQFRFDKPQVQHRTERLAAGDDLGRSVCLSQQGKRRLQMAWTFVAERSRFHAAGLSALRAARIAWTTR